MLMEFAAFVQVIHKLHTIVHKLNVYAEFNVSKSLSDHVLIVVIIICDKDTVGHYLIFHILFVNRQGYYKCSTHPYFAFSSYNSAVILNDPFADGQANTCSFVFRSSMQSLKYDKDLLQVLLFKTYTIVFYKNTIINSPLQVKL